MKAHIRKAYAWLGNRFDLLPKKKQSPVPTDVFNGITACIKAMKALGTGSVLQPSEYDALAWGVNKLVVDNLLDHSLLTAEEMAVGKEVAKRVVARRRQEGN